MKEFIIERILDNGNVLKVEGVDPSKIGKRDKYYLVSCSKCSKDSVLFPTLFSMTMSKFKTRAPCGCSKKPEWSSYQKEVKIARRCKELGYEFLGWVGGFKPRYRVKDHLILFNPASGNSWKSFTFTDFITSEYTDPSIRGKGNLRTNDYHIDKFMGTGRYVEGATFRRSDRVDSNGAKNYWEVNCGTCKEDYQMFTGNLNRGQLGCSCQKFGGYDVNLKGFFYIVRWYGYGKSYIKSGITNREILERVGEQDRRSSHLDYTILYEFYHEDGNVAADCEKYLMSVMETGVCTKELLPDGYTETVHDTQQNIDLILSQVNRFGLK